MADAESLKAEIELHKKKIADGVVEGAAAQQTQAQIAALEHQLAAVTPKEPEPSPEPVAPGNGASER